MIVTIAQPKIDVRRSKIVMRHVDNDDEERGNDIKTISLSSFFFTCMKIML